MEDQVNFCQNEVVERIRECYPNESDKLIKLCYHGLAEPLGYYHPEMVQHLMGVDLEKERMLNLRLGYVFLSSYYFLLDAVVDEHLDNSDHCLYLTHLLSLAWDHFSEIFISAPPEQFSSFKRSFHELIHGNAKAIIDERDTFKSPLHYSEEYEYESIVGRSNSSLVLVEILNCLSTVCKTQTADIKKIVKDFAFYVQLGDDLADWRQDYHSCKYSGFLRELFSANSRILTEEEVEEAIYLSLVFENRCIKIINGLRHISSTLQQKYPGSGNALNLLIENHIARIKESLGNVIQIKLKVKKEMDVN
jgi:hypothetical protein